MFVFGFFLPIPLSHATKKLDNLFNTFCRTESLWQTKFVDVPKKMPKWQIMPHFVPPFLAFCAPLFGIFFCIFFLFNTFWHLKKKHIPVLFVVVTQCDKQKIYFLQWLSVTNKTNLCNSNSVQKTILRKKFISFWYVTKELGKKPETNIFLNLNFTTAFKLLWGTVSATPSASAMSTADMRTHVYLFQEIHVHTFKCLH